MVHFAIPLLRCFRSEKEFSVQPPLTVEAPLNCDVKKGSLFHNRVTVIAFTRPSSRQNPQSFQRLGKEVSSAPAPREFELLSLRLLLCASFACRSLSSECFALLVFRDRFSPVESARGGESCH